MSFTTGNFPLASPIFVSNGKEPNLFYALKQPSRCVLRKRCSENMEQIYWRTTMPKYDFNKIALRCKATLLKSHFGMVALL